ncbi:hypothetical protein FQR65_LT14073 [Abscondita terminalis]|nr:hypothetical protein FQR65_LT14073 [Abscondita terminalis]
MYLLKYKCNDLKTTYNGDHTYDRNFPYDRNDQNNQPHPNRDYGPRESSPYRGDIRALLQSLDLQASQQCTNNVAAQWNFETNVNQATQLEAVNPQLDIPAHQNRNYNNNPYNTNQYDYDRTTYNGDHTYDRNFPYDRNDQNNQPHPNRDYGPRESSPYRGDIRALLQSLDLQASQQCTNNVAAQWNFETNVNQATQLEATDDYFTQNDTVDAIKNKLDSLECTSNKALTLERDTYATITSKAVHSKVIVKPVNTKQPSSKTKSDLLQNINLISGNIGVKQVKSIRDGGVIISCTNVDHSAKLIKAAENKLASEYNVRKIKPTQTRLRIVGLSESLQPNTLLEYLRTQNSELFTSESTCEVLYITP